ncbi:hypothetical protein [Allokutzneria oryzae]|uniref:Uncharacterized protein n=1 Tax=Allokutzneria oryzae TaxID=1378989 RepID=A0ABV5ZU41_9PSEU
MKGTALATFVYGRGASGALRAAFTGADHGVVRGKSNHDLFVASIAILVALGAVYTVSLLPL